MAPRPKPAPHRLGPPPQLTSLKVPVVQQKFAKKVEVTKGGNKEICRILH